MLTETGLNVATVKNDNLAFKTLFSNTVIVNDIRRLNSNEAKGDEDANAINIKDIKNKMYRIFSKKEVVNGDLYYVSILPIIRFVAS